MSPPREDCPQRQALHWLVARQENPGDAQMHRRFQAWLDQAESHRQAWDELTGLDALIVQAHSHNAPARRVVPRLTTRGGMLARGGAALALAACLAVAVLPSLSLRWRADAITGTGEIRQISLDDGSRVTLAPDSAVAIAHGSAARDVTLLRGEAFFEVARDPARPFTAHAGDSAARVLGTAFNLSRHGDGAMVAVAEGSVQVSRGERAHRLGAGDWVDTTAADLAAHGSVPVALVAPWRHGQLAVRDGKVAEVVDVLRRYHHGAILLHGSALAERRVTGSYDPSSPEQALTALVAPLGGRVIRLTPWLLVVSG